MLLTTGSGLQYTCGDKMYQFGPLELFPQLNTDFGVDSSKH